MARIENCSCCTTPLCNDEVGICFVCLPWKRHAVDEAHAAKLGWELNLLREHPEWIEDDELYHYFSTENEINNRHRLSQAVSYVMKDEGLWHPSFDAGISQFIRSIYRKWNRIVTGWGGDLFSHEVMSSPPREISKPGPLNSKRTFELEGTEIILTPTCVRIDGRWVRGGPTRLLIRCIIEPWQGEEIHPLDRLLYLYEKLVGSEEQMLIEKTARLHPEILLGEKGLEIAPRMKLRKNLFSFISSGSNNRETRYRLNGNITFLERFAEIWYGEHGGETAWRLRSTCFLAIELMVIKIPEEVIKANSKSFQFLHSIVDENSRATPHPEGLQIIGKSGVKWLIKSGRGVHRMKWKVSFTDLFGKEHGVCIHTDDGRHLPLGDQITSIALTLLNDIESAKRIENISEVLTKDYPNPRGEPLPRLPLRGIVAGLFAQDELDDE